MATTNATPTFADAGTLFNDATRFLEDGLWQNAVSEGGLGLGSAARVATGQADLQAGIAAGQYTGQALTDMQNIAANLDQEIAAATASVNGGSFGRVAATGFQAVPAGLPAGITAQNAPHANVANLGAIFNAAASLMIGGVNGSHVGLT